MCVCITKSSAFGSGFAKRSSWQGAPAARSPLHPLRPNGASRSPIQPDDGSDRIGAFSAIGETSALPARHTSVCLPPSTRGVPDPFEPCRLQRGEGAFHSSPRPHRPFHGAQPFADWIPIRPFATRYQRAGLGEFPLHLHRTMDERSARSIDKHFQWLCLFSYVDTLDTLPLVWGRTQASVSALSAICATNSSIHAVRTIAQPLRSYATLCDNISKTMPARTISARTIRKGRL